MGADRETIERLEALLAAATPGEWRVADADQSEPLIVSNAAPVIHYQPPDYDTEAYWLTSAEDAALIAESRNALPALLTAARAWLSLVELARRQPGVAVEDAVEAVAGGKEQRNG